jgi:hypothetical protein
VLDVKLSLHLRMKQKGNLIVGTTMLTVQILSKPLKGAVIFVHGLGENFDGTQGVMVMNTYPSNEPPTKSLTLGMTDVSCASLFMGGDPTLQFVPSFGVRD